MSGPAGLRIIVRPGWTGQGLAFPRAGYREVRGMEEFGRTGVYVLWHPADLEKPRAYVGQTDNLLRRFEDHKKGVWWTDAVVFTSTDLSLNIAHVRYLEAGLIERAGQAGRCVLDNKNKPQGSQLSKSDTEIAKQFLSNMLLCLPMLGVNFFEEPPSSEEHRVLFLSSKSVYARGYVTAEGFVVEANSQAVKKERPSIHPYLSRLRKTLEDERVLEDAGNVYRLTQDYRFGSPSTASGVLLGMPSNGRRAWVDEKGNTLAEIAAQTIQEA